MPADIDATCIYVSTVQVIIMGNSQSAHLVSAVSHTQSLNPTSEDEEKNGAKLPKTTPRASRFVKSTHLKPKNAQFGKAKRTVDQFLCTIFPTEQNNDKDRLLSKLEEHMEIMNISQKTYILQKGKSV